MVKVFIVCVLWIVQASDVNSSKRQSCICTACAAIMPPDEFLVEAITPKGETTLQKEIWQVTALSSLERHALTQCIL